MSFIASGALITAAVAIGSQVYSANQQRKALGKQQDAMRSAQEADARKTAEAETNAAVEANSAIADAKRRRRDNALALGDPNNAGTTLGGSSVLGAGSTAQIASKPASTVLGSAAR
jgi:uncharacterized protein HemX